MKYPATFELDDTPGFLVTFRDIPEAVTQGDTHDEAVSMAEDALETAFDIYFELGRKIPAPSEPKDGDIMITVSEEMAQAVSKHNKLYGG